jgi:hypothetical protein
MVPAQTPLPPHLYALLEDLTLANSHLEGASSFVPLLQDNTPELATNISDALSACQEALAVLSNLRTYSDEGKTDE